MLQPHRHKWTDRQIRKRAESRLESAVSRGQKRHINIRHINNFLATPVTDPPGGVENVYIPRVPQTAHKHLTPGHPIGRPPPLSPMQSPDKVVHVCVPFPFLSFGGENSPSSAEFLAEFALGDGQSAHRALCLWLASRPRTPRTPNHFRNSKVTLGH